MKPLAEWDVADLQALCSDQVQESLTLDYKDSRAISKENGFRNELSKDVSAFANSAGGQLIFGVTEAGHLPSGLDEGVDPKTYSREWLEQVINSTIKPRPQGLVIKQILLSSGRVLYAIEVPQATALAPHQANDHKYYKRFNFQSVPMEDYEVRDTFRRAATPQLFLRFRPSQPEAGPDGVTAVVSVDIGNRSGEPSLYRVISLFIDRRVLISGLPGYQPTNRYVEVPDAAQTSLECVAFSSTENIPTNMPIFREYEFHLGKIKVKVGPVPALIGYSIAGPGHFDKSFGWIALEGGMVKITDLEGAGR